MGGLWVDYELMSSIQGLFVAGEANFSDHGANRLGASALMQGLGDGYFILTYAVSNYLASSKREAVTASQREFQDAEKEVAERTKKLLAIGGKRSVDSLHRELGSTMWNDCGMGRTRASLTSAIEKIRALREQFWKELRVLGSGNDLNQELEKAGRVADYFDLGELMCIDGLERDESCGGHFREEHQTEDGEAKRDDVNFCHAAVWEYTGEGKKPLRNVEPLSFETLQLSQRSYK